jgi:putative DNA primase/helicase
MPYKGAKADDPETWGTYEQALRTWKAYPRKYAGIGREFLKAQGITGVDLDKCIDERGQIAPYALAIVKRLNTYTEYSPSGRGLHIWVYGNIPSNVGSDIDGDGDERIEMYDNGRYFTWSGMHLAGTPTTIEDRQEELLALHREVKARRAAAQERKRQEQASARASRQKTTQDNGDTPGDTPYGLAALDGECSDLASTPEGGRNQQLNNAAFKMGRLIAGDELTRSTVEQSLSAAAERAGLDSREIEKTMRSGLEKGLLEPRSAPRTQEYRPTALVSHSLNGNGAGGGKSDDGQAPVSETPGRFNLTDYGNAERLVDLYGSELRYCHSMNNWLVWDGKRWAEDKSGQAERMAKKTIRAIYGEAASIPVEDKTGKAKALASHAIRSESKRAIRDMLILAQSEESIPLTREELDTNLWLLNCSNGTIDLRTGELRKHRREDYITRCIATRFNPDAPRHLWEAFLKKIFNGNTELIAFFKRALGYALTGDTSEQCFFLLYGSGSNGKSTLLEVIQAILSDYAQAAEFKAFLSRDNEGIRNDIARMNGKRLVVAKEADKGKQLAEALVKTLTGGDTITARFLHQEYFDFKPQFKLFLAANHKPEIKGTDLGIWRRVRLVPFEVTIPDKDKDKNLSKKLLEEAEGILAWLVEGCLEWQREGLGEPQIVRDATQAYQTEMDIAAQFLKDNCRLQKPAPGQGKKGEFSTSTTDLMQCFTAWWSEGEKADTKLLKTKLNEMGYYSRRGTGGRFYWQGVELIEPQDSDDPKSKSEGTPQKSEGSEGSEAEKGISLTKTQNSEKKGDSTSLPSLPSLSQEDEASLGKLADLLNSGKLRDKKQVFSTLPEPNYGHLRKEQYLAAIRAGLISSDLRVQQAARDELDKRLAAAS